LGCALSFEAEHVTQQEKAKQLVAMWLPEHADVAPTNMTSF
jgi:hypothetical protein